MRKIAVLVGLSLVSSAAGLAGCNKKMGASRDRADEARPPAVAVDHAGPVAAGGAAQGAGRGSDRDWGGNPWVDPSKDPLSTFAADVDTASYTIARRKLTEGTLPPPASVRVEEWVNYFRYAFPPPPSGTPFSVVM